MGDRKARYNVTVRNLSVNISADGIINGERFKSNMTRRNYRTAWHHVINGRDANSTESCTLSGKINKRERELMLEAGW